VGDFFDRLRFPGRTGKGPARFFKEAVAPQKWALTEHRPPVDFREALPRRFRVRLFRHQFSFLRHRPLSGPLVDSHLFWPIRSGFGKIRLAFL
jgi:hypothetical protein